MELGEYLRFFAALGFVLLLIAGLAALVRRSGFGGRVVAAPAGERRLALVEVRPIDAKRKLVLVRRDDREHLVLLGLGGDLLIESGIEAPPQSPAAVREPASVASTAEPRNVMNRLLGKLRSQPS